MTSPSSLLGLEMLGGVKLCRGEFRCCGFHLPFHLEDLGGSGMWVVRAYLGSLEETMECIRTALDTVDTGALDRLSGTDFNMTYLVMNK